MSEAALELRHPGGTTPVVIGTGILVDAIERIGAVLSGRCVFVVSSPTVVELHGEALDTLEGAAGHAAAVERLIVPDGETAKRLEFVGTLWEELARRGGKRDSVIFAFGGGSVGDLAGFAAATFLRGVALVQVPTTLLAQVDASLGGKTGIDLAAGKNLAGAFHHPILVASDTRFLATLPPAELRSGLVEAIKMAALFDSELLRRIERDLDSLVAGDPEALVPVVRAAAGIKIGVVERDPFEAGERQLLNYGHTLGHALEAEAGFSGLRHGEAVGWGIRFANRLARARGAEETHLSRIDALIERLELTRPAAVDGGRLLERIARDKKSRASGLTWILAAGEERGERVPGIDASQVARELDLFLAEFAGAPPNV